MYQNGTVLFFITVLFLNISQSYSYAGGFSSSSTPFGSVSAKSLAANYTYLQSKSAHLHSRNYATVSTKTINGEILKGMAEAGNQLEINVGNKKSLVVVDQKSEAKTKIYLKNKNILAKAQSRNTLKVKVKGEFSLESEEYAVSMGRFTALGTQTKAYARNHNRLEAKGLVRLESGNIAQSTGQVGN